MTREWGSRCGAGGIRRGWASLAAALPRAVFGDVRFTPRPRLRAAAVGRTAVWGEPRFGVNLAMGQPQVLGPGPPPDPPASQHGTTRVTRPRGWRVYFGGRVGLASFSRWSAAVPYEEDGKNVTCDKSGASSSGRGACA